MRAMPTTPTIERLRALLSNCSNMTATAKLAGVHVRTLYRIRDEGQDITTMLADRIAVAAKKHQRKPARAEA